MAYLASTYQQLGKMTEATNMQEEVLAKRKMILGDDHPNTLTSMAYLASTYQQLGKMTEATNMQEEVLAKRKMILGDDHPDTLTSMAYLASTYQQQGKMTEASNMQEKMLTITQGCAGDDDLPHGWEKRYTDVGLPYYLDHNTRTTSWLIPLAARELRGSLP